MVGPIEREFRGLSGAELIASGLEDLKNGGESPNALLVLLNASRLRELGVDVPQREDDGGLADRLYALLEKRYRKSASARYTRLNRCVDIFVQVITEQRRGATAYRSTAAGEVVRVML